MIQSLAYLQTHNVTHGDICPKNIFITSDGIFKVLDQSLLARGQNAYLKLMSGEDSTEKYLSP
jgi:serine/threonine protein kinase